jgi:hypothetical protein
LPDGGKIDQVCKQKDETNIARKRELRAFRH